MTPRNSWKLLIDFKMYDNDGAGSPQMPVQPNFNMVECMRMLEEYKGGHEQFPVAQGIVDEFVQQYKESHDISSDDGIKHSTRGKYWRPNLKNAEWDLLNRRLSAEMESSEQYIDELTKWLYSDEKGVQVFAVYGIGDGTEPTPLYASGGKRAMYDYRAFIAKKEDFQNGAYRSGQTLNRMFKALRRKYGDFNGDISELEKRTGENANDRVSFITRESDGRGSSERGTQNQRGVSGVKKSVKNSSTSKIDVEYLALAKYPEKNKAQLKRMVEDAAIAEREYLGSMGRSGYDEIIRTAIKDGRVLDYDTKKGDLAALNAPRVSRPRYQSHH